MLCPLFSGATAASMIQKPSAVTDRRLTGTKTGSEDPVFFAPHGEYNIPFRIPVNEGYCQMRPGFFNP